MTEILVELTIEGGVAWVTMNRPKALNALNRDMTRALVETINPLEHDPDVRCVVIRGGDHFMAGGDLKTFHAMLRPAAPGQSGGDRGLHSRGPQPDHRGPPDAQAGGRLGQRGLRRVRTQLHERRRSRHCGGQQLLHAGPTP